MIEITSVTLENEMDVILAHKQSMRLAELAGLSISAQTTFATAVSEVSRNAIGEANQSSLRLFVSNKADRQKFITATLEDKRKEFRAENDEGYVYAKRLVSNISVKSNAGINHISLNYRLPLNTRIDDFLVEKWTISLNTDPAISPYEEIKRKNRQLAEMAGRLQESEQQYKNLTDSLPILIMTLNDDGAMTYANSWVSEYSGETIEMLNKTQWKDIIHPEDFDKSWGTWKDQAKVLDTVVIPDTRLRSAKTGEFRWHTGVIIAINDDEGSAKCWNCFMVDINSQKIVEETLKDNFELKATQAELEDKIGLLNRSNYQLEQFAYVASHDLQEPLRKITFYSDFLRTKYKKDIPEDALILFNNLMNSSERMKVLIQDILTYSTVRQADFEEVDLNEIATEAMHDLEMSIKEKNAIIDIKVLPTIKANSRQLKQLFENLISNSLKYSKQGIVPQISVSSNIIGKEVQLSFSDNGIGFEKEYIGKMFSIFQRLHTREKFSGTGIGLAICKKIVDLHNGKIEAISEPSQGATFLITLPIDQNLTTLL